MTERFLDLDTVLKERGLCHGVGDFRGSWDQRNPYNVPGPIYVGDDDACGCGPIAAPANVFALDWGEFVFRQPTSEAELDAVLEAAAQNPVCAYALDGSAHWTRKSISEWWLWSKADHSRRVPQPGPAHARWRSFMWHDAELYLRRYVVSLETGSAPDRRARLPEL